MRLATGWPPHRGAPPQGSRVAAAPTPAQRFLANRAAVLGLGLLGLLLALAVLGPHLVSQPFARIDLAQRDLPPGPGHPFGTDALGRDLFARVWVGGRVSLLVAATATAADLLVGVCYGGVAGLVGGALGEAMMRLVDTLYGLPVLLVVILLLVVMGPGLASVITAITLVNWLGMARLVRTEAAALREREYVLAARGLGVSEWRILGRHLLPAAAGPILVWLSYTIPAAIFAEAFLSFLGLGVQPPLPSWGSLLSSAANHLGRHPGHFLFPAAALTSTLLAFCLIGDGLRDAWRPQPATGRAAPPISAEVPAGRPTDAPLGRRRAQAPTVAQRPGAAPGGACAALLVVRDLTVVAGPAGQQLLGGLSFTLGRGEALALIGESGAGKSTCAHAVLGLFAPGAAVGGSVLLEGREVLGAPTAALRPLRGGLVGLVPQEAGSALNPTQTIGAQVAEAARLHLGLGPRAAWAHGVTWLDRVGLPDAPRRAREYPHQWSGGMRQRALVAMALAGGPRLLVADEPTSALDPPVAAGLLELLAGLRVELGLAVLLVTHDLTAAARLAERVAVLYAGRVVEVGPAAAVLERPAHPYTAGLLRSLPQRGLQPLPGRQPDPGRPHPGCAFAPRCPVALPVCARLLPPAFPSAAGAAACWLLDPEAPAGARRSPEGAEGWAIRV